MATKDTEMIDAESSNNYNNNKTLSTFVDQPFGKPYGYKSTRTSESISLNTDTNNYNNYNNVDSLGQGLQNMTIDDVPNVWCSLF